MGNSVSEPEVNNFSKVNIDQVMGIDNPIFALEEKSGPFPIEKKSFMDSIENSIKENPLKEGELTEFDYNPRFLKACKDGDLSEVEKLVSQGIDYKKYYNQAAMIEASSGQLKIVKYLISLGSDITDMYGDAIVLASAHGHLEMVKYLVSLGMNIKAQNDRPIIYASANGHLDVVKYLIEQGAHVNAQDGSALIMASSRGYLDVVKYLLTHDANINIQHYEPLRIAILHDQLEMVKYLIEKGSKMDNSFLNVVSNVETIKYLISIGTEIPNTRGKILNEAITEIISEKLMHEKIETNNKGLLPLIGGTFSPVEPLVYCNTIKLENIVRIPIILKESPIHHGFYAIPNTIDLFDDFKIEMLPGDTLLSAELYIGQEPKFLLKRIGLNTTYGKCKKHSFFDRPVNNLYSRVGLWIKIKLENDRDFSRFRKLMIYGYICPENIRRPLILNSTFPKNIQEILEIKPAEL